MLLPLYDELQQKKPQKSPDYNRGLLFERFFDHYDNKENKFEVPKDGKSTWLKEFTKAGNTDALQLAAKQQLSLVNALDGKYKFFNTQWHFVTGTGYPHPVENGLLWHKTYGVPYLSGAAVKGLVRAWVEEWEYPALEAKKRAHLLSWFGSDGDDKEPKEQQKTSQTGDIIFFDAFPVQAVQLKTDIMTPHYGDWYKDGGKIQDLATEPEKVPADWHDPKPIPFLVVDKNASFLFSVAPSSRMKARDTKEVIEKTMLEVIDCLTQALEWLGAGAKTATGYGQMTSPDDNAKEWLTEAIEALKKDKDLKGQPEINLWKKPLSERWLFATSEIKQPALELIKNKWQELKINWDNPEGKSAQEAKRNFSKN